MTHINSLQRIDSKYIGTPAKWREFLCLWEQKRIDLGLTDSNSVQLVWEYEVNSHQIENKIIETESRLMLTLPKSYKDFIFATDGNHMPEWLLKKVHSEPIFSVEKTDWLRNLSPELVYEDYVVEPDIIVENERYYRYDKKQDDYAYRREYLEYCLKLNTDPFGEYEILLNQKEHTSDGELEAWFFYTGEGNILRYTSFASLIIGLYLLDVTQISAVCVLTNKDDPYSYSNLLLSAE